jgi:hypothetical protein
MNTTRKALLRALAVLGLAAPPLLGDCGGTAGFKLTYDEHQHDVMRETKKTDEGTTTETTTTTSHTNGSVGASTGEAHAHR